jgi:hypothetical protein
MRARPGIVIAAIAVIIVLLVWRMWRPANKPSSGNSPGRVDSSPAAVARSSAASGETAVYAHNLMLRKGPSFRVYVRWLRGKMVRTHGKVNPSFDDPQSFYIDIAAGILRANIGDIEKYLNSDGLSNSPLKNVHLWGDGNQINLTGTVHKLVALPIHVTGEIAALPDSRIRIHVTKINVLKIPFKAVLGGLHISVSDLFHSKDVNGLQVTGDDIYLDTLQLLPPPQIRGQLTAVRVVNPDLEEVFGNSESEVARVEQWRNFLHLEGGAIDFGRLTMHPVDLIMIDISDDPWFNLDLAHYQKQLVYGYTRMTPQAALQIFMPDLRSVPQNETTQNIGIEWMKNRDLPPPKDVLHH